jgi:hypothetical protein
MKKTLKTYPDLLFGSAAGAGAAGFAAPAFPDLRLVSDLAFFELSLLPLSLFWPLRLPLLSLSLSEPWLPFTVVVGAGAVVDGWPGFKVVAGDGGPAFGVVAAAAGDGWPGFSVVVGAPAGGDGWPAGGEGPDFCVVAVTGGDGWPGVNDGEAGEAAGEEPLTVVVGGGGGGGGVWPFRVVVIWGEFVVTAAFDAGGAGGAGGGEPGLPVVVATDAGDDGPELPAGLLFFRAGVAVVLFKLGVVALVWPVTAVAFGAGCELPILAVVVVVVTLLLAVVELPGELLAVVVVTFDAVTFGAAVVLTLPPIGVCVETATGKPAPPPVVLPSGPLLAMQLLTACVHAFALSSIMPMLSLMEANCRS